MEIKPIGQIEVVPNMELVNDICEFLESAISKDKKEETVNYNELDFND